MEVKALCKGWGDPLIKALPVPNPGLCVPPAPSLPCPGTGTPTLHVKKLRLRCVIGFAQCHSLSEWSGRKLNPNPAGSNVPGPHFGMTPKRGRPWRRCGMGPCDTLSPCCQPAHLMSEGDWHVCQCCRQEDPDVCLPNAPVAVTRRT